MTDDDKILAMLPATLWQIAERTNNTLYGAATAVERLEKSNAVTVDRSKRPYVIRARE